MTLKNAAIALKQLEFAAWLYKYGADNPGGKISAVTAHYLATIYGTEVGLAHWSGACREDVNEFWKVNDNKLPTFRIWNVWSIMKFKSWFSSASQEKLRKAIAKATRARDILAAAPAVPCDAVAADAVVATEELKKAELELLVDDAD